MGTQDTAKRDLLLIAEDDEAIMFGLKEDAITAGFPQEKTLYATRGREALGIVETMHARLAAVCTDLRMQDDVSGVQVAQMAMDRHVPSVTISTATPQDIPDAMRTLPGLTIVVKPSSPDFAKIMRKS